MVSGKDSIVKIVLKISASMSIIIVAGIFFFLLKEALPFANEPGIGELFSFRWVPVSFQKECFGVIPLLSGSILITAIALVIMVPFGVITAVYIAEIASGREREILKPFIEILAGIPSVVIGFFGLVVLVPFIQSLFNLQSGLNALSGAILLALMAVPTVISIAEDAIRSVPDSYKSASLALGASPMTTVWRITVPAALPGIVTAIMLGVGRVIGETMAVMMVTGNTPLITASPVESVRTMTATIAAEMGEVAFGSVHYRALFCVGIVLLFMTFLLNVIAQRILMKYRLN